MCSMLTLGRGRLLRASKTVAGVVTAVIFAILLNGCPPNPVLTPEISVTQNGKVFIISGDGFADVPACAFLTLVGAATGTRKIGTASCSGGNFADIPYPYSYAGCAHPRSTTNVTVFAVDTQGSNASAAQTLQIPWDTFCSLQAADCTVGGAACQACGGEGEPVCPNGGCVQPAADGQPVCSNGACTSVPCSFEADLAGVCHNSYPDLNPALSNPNDRNSQLICTATCGHTSGYLCYPYMSDCIPRNGGFPGGLEDGAACKTNSPTTGLGLFSCYDNSQLTRNASCACVPSNGTCLVNQSTGNGTCAPKNAC
jgi:hypothetical protein